MIYALPTDAARHFDPTVTRADLTSNEFIGRADDWGTIRTHVEQAESDFERDTGNALREARVGVPNRPESYEYHPDKFWKNQPSSVFLNHRNILPFDPDEGDALEIRDGVDSWRSIIDKEGQLWTAEWRDGILSIYAKLRRMRRPHTNSLRDGRFVRACYRYGGLGQSKVDGGETALSSQAEAGENTSLEVEDASKIPPGANLLLVGPDTRPSSDGSGGPEYVRVDTIDRAADTISLRERGDRGTEDTDHESGETVHYCPPGARDGIAAWAARLMIRYDDYTENMAEGSAQDVSRRDKIEQLEAEYDRTTGRYDDNLEAV